MEFYNRLNNSVKGHMGERHTYPVGSRSDTQFSETEGSQRIFSPMPTPDDLFNRAMIGLERIVGSELLNTLGDPIYLNQVMSAVISEFEMKYSTALSSRIAKETFDGTKIKREGGNNLFIQLPRWPVTHIESMTWTWAHASQENPLFQFQVPPQWIVLEGNTVRVAPDLYFSPVGVFGPISQHNFRPGFSHLQRKFVNPSEWMITFRFGFEYDKLPSALVELISIYFMSAVLEEMAGVLLPNNTVTTSIDGVSQSSSTPGQDLLINKAKMLRERAKSLENAVLGEHSSNLNMGFIGL